MNNNTKDEFYRDQKVVFGRSKGEQTHGTVVKVNKKSIKVRQDEARGTLRDYPVGTVWKVARSLVRPADQTHTTIPGGAEDDCAPTPKRSEAEIMKDILEVYAGLSPENLTCDGELPASQVRRNAAILNRSLRALEKELGRKVDESEAYRYAGY
jgi:hypothetical protein